MSKTDIKALLEAGAHFGHKTSRWNPKMRNFIHSKRGGIHIIDLVQTADLLEEAAKFAESVASSNKKVLFVGTKKHIAPTIKEAAESAGMPYVSERWLGGMLTNFSTISERIKRLKKLEEDLESGELSEKYNKREILEFQEERDKLAKDFQGISDMNKVPGALFVSDCITERTAIKEAARLGIPIIGIVDTNGDPSDIDYVIPANDDAVKTVKLVAEAIAEAVAKGAKKATKKPAPDEAEKKKATKKPATKKTESNTSSDKPAKKKTASSKKSESSKEDK